MSDVHQEDLYRNREQTQIKHLFLSRYLQAAAFKTLQGRSPVFNFVDAFAGPWKTADSEDYTDTSFDQAIRTLDGVREYLRERGKTGLTARFCFCEKIKASAERLRQYAKRFEERSDVQIHVFQGEFETHLDDIAKICGDGFTFTFIDPTGWNIGSGQIFSFLKAHNGEFLLNFMQDHINRHAEYADVAQSFGRFLADPEWKDRYEALPNCEAAADRVLHVFKGRAREAGAAKFLPDIPILAPRQNRMKMRLVLGTNNGAGVEVFRNTHKDVELKEKQLRQQIKDDAKFQSGLFPPEQLAAIDQGHDGVGCAHNKKRAEDFMLKLLSSRSERKDTFLGLAYRVMERVPVRMPDVKDVAMDMRERGLIAFDLPPPKKKPQDDTMLSLPQASQVPQPF